VLELGKLCLQPCTHNLRGTRSTSLHNGIQFITKHYCNYIIFTYSSFVNKLTVNGYPFSPPITNTGNVLAPVRRMDPSVSSDQKYTPQNVSIQILISCDLTSSIMLLCVTVYIGLSCILGGIICCKPIKPSRELRIYKRVWRPNNACQDSFKSSPITVCHRSDFKSRWIRSEVAQSPRCTGLLPAVLPKQAFRIPSAAGSSQLHFSLAFSFAALQAVLGCNNLLFVNKKGDSDQEATFYIFLL
jgi:hypothetical protein